MQISVAFGQEELLLSWTAKEHITLALYSAMSAGQGGTSFVTKLQISASPALPLLRSSLPPSSATIEHLSLPTALWLCCCFCLWRSPQQFLFEYKCAENKAITS